MKGRLRINGKFAWSISIRTASTSRAEPVRSPLPSAGAGGPDRRPRSRNGPTRPIGHSPPRVSIVTIAETGSGDGVPCGSAEGEAEGPRRRAGCDMHTARRYGKCRQGDVQSILRSFGTARRRPLAGIRFRPIIASMPVLRSRLDPASDEVRANHDAMAALVAELRQRQSAVAGRGAGGDDRSIARHRERGKLPVRERIDRLVDPGSPFLEFSPLAANGLYDDEAPGAGSSPASAASRGRGRRHRQRRDGQGRDVLPADRQEAPPGPGDRLREPPAVRLSRRHGGAFLRSRPTSSPTATISAGSSTTRPGCRRPGSPRSRW